MKLMATSRGFALPTVMIASVVMMMVLLASLTGTTSISAGIRGQYNDKVAKETAEAGYAMAQACLSIHGQPTWSTASPLRPGTTCSGGTQCTTIPDCYVVNNSTMKTTFTVNTATLNDDMTYNVPVEADIQLLRVGDSTVNTSRSFKDNRLLKTRMGWKLLGIGTSHSCAVTINYKTYCWGYGGSSGIGNGMTNPGSVTSPYPIAQGEIPGSVRLVSVVSNNSWGSHCGLGSNGKAYCWGSNAYGQLGNNTTTDSNIPVQVLQGAVPGNVTFTSVSLGFYHACALGTDNEVYCWGRNNFGQFGNNTTVDSLVPVLASAQGAIPVGVTAKSLAVGYYTSCIIGSNDRGYCWGYNSSGQFGNGNSTTNSPVPVAISQGSVPAGVNWKKISVGTYHSCGIGTNDRAYCWGGGVVTNGHYALGNGGTAEATTPVAVSQGATPNGTTWLALDAGQTVTCGIANNNRAYCWGTNQSGQLGNNSLVDSNVPVAVSQGAIPVGSILTGIDIGGSTPCVTDTLTIAYCWGNNPRGDVGNGLPGGTDVLTPVRVRTPAEQGLSY